ncbi:hypothetical protein [Achromobacter dolens]|uniref:hypothetical protein n=1 Tax=Achromobacter dolens TaxID=1287738 RepID=UPI0011A8A9ED|nr:hypothetical protein [Achromobacter dolens]
MPCLRRLPLLAATLLTSAAALAQPPAAPASATSAPAQSALSASADAAPPAPQERLRVGLSDPDTKLVLPWFVTTLTDAVNQGKSANETGQALLDGL